MGRDHVAHLEADADGLGVVAVVADEEGRRPGELVAVVVRVAPVRLVDDPDQGVAGGRFLGAGQGQVDHPPAEGDVVGGHPGIDLVPFELGLDPLQGPGHRGQLGLVLGQDPGQAVGHRRRGRLGLRVGLGLRGGLARRRNGGLRLLGGRPGQDPGARREKGDQAQQGRRGHRYLGHEHASQSVPGQGLDAGGDHPPPPPGPRRPGPSPRPPSRRARGASPPAPPARPGRPATARGRALAGPGPPGGAPWPGGAGSGSSRRGSPAAAPPAPGSSLRGSRARPPIDSGRAGGRSPRRSSRGPPGDPRRRAERPGARGSIPPSARNRARSAARTALDRLATRRLTPWSHRPSDPSTRIEGALRARIRNVAWKASAEAWASPRNRRQTPRTIGPCRATIASKAASDEAWPRPAQNRAIRSSSGKSPDCPALEQRRKILAGVPRTRDRHRSTPPLRPDSPRSADALFMQAGRLNLPGFRRFSQVDGRVGLKLGPRNVESERWIIVPIATSPPQGEID